MEVMSCLVGDLCSLDSLIYTGLLFVALVLRFVTNCQLYVFCVLRSFVFLVAGKCFQGKKMQVYTDGWQV